jgi:hypothetical protein
MPRSVISVRQTLELGVTDSHQTQPPATTAKTPLVGASARILILLPASRFSTPSFCLQEPMPWIATVKAALYFAARAGARRLS